MHDFGGVWTEDKLNRLRKYLPAYTRIFKSNPKAQFFNTIYVDAFAGTGYRAAKKKSKAPLFGDTKDEGARSFLKGSARIALEVEPPFDQYIFVEENASHAEALDSLCKEFVARRDRVEIIKGDANDFLRAWIASTNWKITRAVVFLDPYGMEIEWDIIRALGHTQAIDLWILFSLEGANRHLTREKLPDDYFAARLDKLFGGHEWQNEFYVENQQSDLFKSEASFYKDADFAKIAAFFKKRLGESFYRVAENDLILRNSRNVPLFLLCFAASNVKGASAGIKIANHVLKN